MYRTIRETAGTWAWVFSKIGEGTVTYQYSAVGGTAFFGSDFSLLPGTLTLTGSQTKTLTGAIVDDNIYEGPQTFSTRTVRTYDGLVTTHDVFTIDDSEDKPILSVASRSVSENSGAITFTVTASNPAAFAYDVAVSMRSGGTLSSSDYTVGSRSVRMEAGQTTATYTLNLINDSLKENAETLTLDFRSDYSAATTVLTVNDDDGTTNRAPVAVDDSITLPDAGRFYVDALWNDRDPDGDSVRLTRVVSTGSPYAQTSVVDGKISFQYMRDLAQGQGVTFSLVYEIADSRGATDTGTIKFTIRDVNTLQTPIYGDPGANVLKGTNLSERIFGQAGDDTLYGGFGKDQLYGGAGNDSLYGGGAADLFCFGANYGRDVAKDFSFSDQDRIAFLGGVVRDFADLMANHAQQASAGAVFSIDASNSILIAGHSLTEFSAANFLFN